jgi:hypothetical protein
MRNRGRARSVRSVPSVLAMRRRWVLVGLHGAELLSLEADFDGSPAAQSVRDRVPVRYGEPGDRQQNEDQLYRETAEQNDPLSGCLPTEQRLASDLVHHHFRTEHQDHAADSERQHPRSERRRVAAAPLLSRPARIPAQPPHSPDHVGAAKEEHYTKTTQDNPSQTGQGTAIEQYLIADHGQCHDVERQTQRGDKSQRQQGIFRRAEPISPIHC